MEEGLTLNIIHSSLKDIAKKDSHGNDPFWMRCSAVEQLDAPTIDFKPLESIFDLIVVLPYTYDKYRLKNANICLKQDNGYYLYILDDNFCDYDLEPFIERKEIWWKEIQTMDTNQYLEENV